MISDAFRIWQFQKMAMAGSTSRYQGSVNDAPVNLPTYNTAYMKGRTGMQGVKNRGVGKTSGGQVSWSGDNAPTATTNQPRRPRLSRRSRRGK